MYDGSQIRELECSKSASINGMDIYGGHFVTGGGDKFIKVTYFSTRSLIVTGLPVSLFLSFLPGLAL